MFFIEQTGELFFLSHHVNARISQVIAVKKLAARRSAAPDNHLLPPPHLGFVKLSDQGRNNMARLEVVIVARSIEIGRHSRKVLCTVLTVVAPAHLYAGNFGHGIGTIGWLERTC